MKHISWLSLGLVLFMSCAVKPPVQLVAPAERSPTSYSDGKNWAALPFVTDPSDDVPVPLQTSYHKDSSVDVFFIHPTTFTSGFNGQWTASIDDGELNTKTDETTIRLQASVFNEYNLYAPRYQQAHVMSFYSEDTVQSRAALNWAYADVKAAFEYYLENWNRGKPIIIASHSQGTFHAKYLLREFFEGKALQQKLVAAYIIGLQIEPDFFSQLPVCADSLQTGCYLGWRTFRTGYEPDYRSSFRNSVVVNPLNWKSDTSYAGVELHKGSVLRNFKKSYFQVSDAQVHDDLLWVSRPKFPGSRLYKSKNYHIGDINLFYLNIRENLRARVAAFNAKQP